MKISALASLLGVAAATLLPGVSASESESSLRGTAILPGEVDLLELGFQCGNWDSSKCAGTGGNTCYRVTTQCSKICDCEINYSTSQCYEGTCVAYGQPIPPVPTPTPPQRYNCRVGAGDCASNQWCSTSLYGQCNGGQGQCTYFLGGGTCPSNHSPVCGCDGKTYANQCQATNAGVNVNYAGSCYNPNRSPTRRPTRRPTRPPTRRPTRRPTKKPSPQKVGSYCTATPNYACYRSGYPPCCHNGQSCPKNYSDALAKYPCNYENESLGAAEMIEGE